MPYPLASIVALTLAGCLEKRAADRRGIIDLAEDAGSVQDPGGPVNPTSPDGGEPVPNPRSPGTEGVAGSDDETEREGEAESENNRRSWCDPSPREALEEILSGICRRREECRETHPEFLPLVNEDCVQGILQTEGLLRKLNYEEIYEDEGCYHYTVLLEFFALCLSYFDDLACDPYFTTVERQGWQSLEYLFQENPRMCRHVFITLE